MDQDDAIARQQEQARELITSGHVWSAVWFLAWPTAINTLIQTAYNIINRLFLGNLPSGVGEALAAVGIAGGLLMMQFALMFGLSIGASALVSRFVGARQYDDAVQATRQSLILAVIVGFVSSIPLVVLAEPLMVLSGAHGNVAPIGATYLIIIAASSIPLFLYWTMTSALRSVGNVMSALYAGGLTIVVNILFDWLLIFGIGPFPAWGVKGAAVSTVISRLAGLALSIWFIDRSVLKDSLRQIRGRVEWFGRIMRIGLPAMFQNLLWTSAYMGFIRILGYLPNATLAQASLTVALTIESTAFMPGAAYATAVTPLVGQNLGAGKPERAEHSAWVAAGQAVAIMSLVAVLFLAIPRRLALIFTKDAAIVGLIASYLRINSISEPFLALGMVLRGALQGAGDVNVPAGIIALTLWIIRLPLTWLMAIYLGWGATGAWWAMSLSTILSGILSVIWFKWGTWRNVRV